MVLEAVILTAAGCVLAGLVVFDIREQRLPDGLNAVFALLGVVLHFSQDGAPTDVGDLLLGSVFGAGLLYAVRAYFLWRRGREGLGLGDVKYVAAAGLWVGLEGIFLVIGLGAALTLLIVFSIRLLRGQGIRIGEATTLPFGPGLIAATLVVFSAVYF